MTHTAMPLQVMKGPNALDIADANGNPICVMVGEEADCQHIAHFIVRAANAHDDLVKIAEALVHKSEFNGGVWPSWMPFDEEHCRKLIAGTV